jgi:hypothetical protein
MALLVVFFWDSVLDLGFGSGFVGSKPSSSCFFFWIGSPILEYPVAFLPFYFFGIPLAWGGLAWQAAAFFGCGLVPPFLLESPPEVGWLVRPVYTGLFCVGEELEKS